MTLTGSRFCEQAKRLDRKTIEPFCCPYLTKGWYFHDVERLLCFLDGHESTIRGIGMYTLVMSIRYSFDTDWLEILCLEDEQAKRLDRKLSSVFLYHG